MPLHFLDTSIWIDYFNNKRPQLNDRIEKLLDEDLIAYNGIVQSELLLGAQTEKHFKKINDNLKGLHFLDNDKHYSLIAKHLKLERYK